MAEKNQNIFIECPKDDRKSNANTLIQNIAANMASGNRLYDAFCSFSKPYLNYKEEREDTTNEFLFNLMRGAAKTFKWVIYKDENLTKNPAFMAWSKVCILNLARSKLRKKAREIKIKTNLVNDLNEMLDYDFQSFIRRRFQRESPYDSLNKKDMYEMLKEGLKQLSERQRDLLILKYDMGFNYQNISNLLEIPVGTVKSGLNLARKNLREIVETSYETSE